MITDHGADLEQSIRNVETRIENLEKKAMDDAQKMIEGLNEREKRIEEFEKKVIDDLEKKIEDLEDRLKKAEKKIMEELQPRIKTLENRIEQDNKVCNLVSQLVEEIKKLSEKSSDNNVSVTNGSLTPAQVQSMKNLRAHRKILHEAESEQEKKGDSALEIFINILPYFSGIYAFIFQMVLLNHDEYWFVIGLILVMLFILCSGFVITWFKIKSAKERLKGHRIDFQKILVASKTLVESIKATNRTTSTERTQQANSNEEITVLQIEEQLLDDSVFSSFYDDVGVPM